MGGVGGFGDGVRDLWEGDDSGVGDRGGGLGDLSGDSIFDEGVT